jgi:hypothetical protein
MSCWVLRREESSRIEVVSVLFPGEPPVQMFARVAPLSGGLEVPFQLAGRRIQGVEIAIVGAELSQPPCHRRGRRDPALRFEFPLQCAGFSVDGIKVPVCAHKNQVANHYPAMRQRGRQHELPFDLADRRTPAASRGGTRPKSGIATLL